MLAILSIPLLLALAPRQNAENRQASVKTEVISHHPHLLGRLFHSHKRHRKHHHNKEKDDRHDHKKHEQQKGSEDRHEHRHGRHH